MRIVWWLCTYDREWTLWTYGKVDWRQFEHFELWFIFIKTLCLWCGFCKLSHSLGVYFKSINFSCDIFIIALDQCLDKEAGDGLVNDLHLGSKPGNMKKLLRKNMKYVFFCQLKASICNLSSLITYWLPLPHTALDHCKEGLLKTLRRQNQIQFFQNNLLIFIPWSISA